MQQILARLKRASKRFLQSKVPYPLINEQIPDLEAKLDLVIHEEVGSEKGCRCPWQKCRAVNTRITENVRPFKNPTIERPCEICGTMIVYELKWESHGGNRFVGVTALACEQNATE